jgi:hypothetical protein
MIAAILQIGLTERLWENIKTCLIAFILLS